MCFSAPLSTTYIKALTWDTTTLLVIGSNIIFEEVDYFENSDVRGKAPYAFT